MTATTQQQPTNDTEDNKLMKALFRNWGLWCRTQSGLPVVERSDANTDIPQADELLALMIEHVMRGDGTRKGMQELKPHYFKLLHATYFKHYFLPLYEVSQQLGIRQDKFRRDLNSAFVWAHARIGDKVDALKELKNS